MHDDTYSVWNWSKGRYDYYRGRKRPFRTRSTYPKSSGLKGVGEVAESSVHHVPLGARKVGEGDEALGTVASPPRRSGLLFAAAGLGLLWWLR